jgi:hypothetical protein
MLVLKSKSVHVVVICLGSHLCILLDAEILYHFPIKVPVEGSLEAFVNR